jgi:hypothetical protein
MRNKAFIRCLFISIMCWVWPLNLQATENSECMECHSDESLTREGGDEIIMSRISELLFLDEDKFHLSVHHINEITCVDCHADIEELNYDEDIPHKTRLEPVNCTTCHEEEGEAFTQSVHMEIRGKGITMQCYACHGYHYVTRLASASVAERENLFCLKCHNPYNYHDWLPQKKAHFAFVECTVCHAPTVPHHIHLTFFDLVTKEFFTGNEIIETLDIDYHEFMPLIDVNKDNIINTDEFENLILILRQKNIWTEVHAELVVELEPIVHDVIKTDAVNKCEQCHSADSPLFNAVNIVLSLEDGSAEHYEVDRGVLDSFIMSHFSALGGTRVKFLDKLGIAIILGGIAGASGHWFIRLVTSPLRRRKDDENND